MKLQEYSRKRNDCRRLIVLRLLPGLTTEVSTSLDSGRFVFPVWVGILRMHRSLQRQVETSCLLKLHWWSAEFVVLFRRDQRSTLSSPQNVVRARKLLTAFVCESLAYMNVRLRRCISFLEGGPPRKQTIRWMCPQLKFNADLTILRTGRKSVPSKL